MSHNFTFNVRRDIGKKTACIESAVKSKKKHWESLVTLPQNKAENTFFFFFLSTAHMQSCMTAASSQSRVLRFLANFKQMICFFGKRDGIHAIQLSSLVLWTFLITSLDIFISLCLTVMGQNISSIELIGRFSGSR